MNLEEQPDLRSPKIDQNLKRQMSAMSPGFYFPFPSGADLQQQVQTCGITVQEQTTDRG